MTAAMKRLIFCFITSKLSLRSEITNSIMAGLIVQYLSWRWEFLILLPFTACSLIFGYLHMQNVTQRARLKLDIPSLLLSTVGFGGIVYSFSSVSSSGWSSIYFVIPLAVGIAGLLLFAWRQFVIKHPVLNLRALGYPMFALGVVEVVFSMMVIFATMILLPIFLQSATQLNAFAAGLVMLPGGLINGLVSPVTGRLFDKIGPRPLVIPGFIMIIAMLGFLSHITVASSVIVIIILHTCLLIGISGVIMPAQTNGLNQLPPELHAHGSAIVNTLMQVAGAIGTSLFVSIMAASAKQYVSHTSASSISMVQTHAIASGVQHAFFVAMCVGIAGFIASIWVKRVRPSH